MEVPHLSMIVFEFNTPARLADGSKIAGPHQKRPRFDEII